MWHPSHLPALVEPSVSSSMLNPIVLWFMYFGLVFKSLCEIIKYLRIQVSFRVYVCSYKPRVWTFWFVICLSIYEFDLWLGHVDHRLLLYIAQSQRCSEILSIIDFRHASYYRKKKKKRLQYYIKDKICLFIHDFKETQTCTHHHMPNTHTHVQEN